VAQTICLNMIVKNEARVIRRCLDSVKPFIHTWVIVDTGSADGTQEVIRSCLQAMPGELHERPWVDFGYNRSEALALARGKADYILIIDADEVMLPEEGFSIPNLTGDAYQIRHLAGESRTTFWLTQLVRGDMPFRYKGVLHEAIDCELPHRTGRIHGVVTKGFFDSARNVDPIAKYRSDASVLEQALEKEPDNRRYVFYLAQSYRDSRMLREAMETYEKRASMGGWEEEIYYSLYQAAAIRERMGQKLGPVIDTYLRAHQARPRRAEPLCELARHLRQQGQMHAAWLFADQARKIPRPDDILFLDEGVYAWRAMDEYAVCSYYVGRAAEALDIATRLLSMEELPGQERVRIEGNCKFYRQKAGQ